MNWTEAMTKAHTSTARTRIRSRVYGWHTDQGWTYRTSWAIRPHR